MPKILCASTPRDARCLFLTAATTRRDVSNLSRSKDHEAGRQRHGGAGDGCIERNRTDARRRSRARAPRRGRLKNAAQANALVSELAYRPRRVIAIQADVNCRRIAYRGMLGPRPPWSTNDTASGPEITLRATKTPYGTIGNGRRRITTKFWRARRDSNSRPPGS